MRSRISGDELIDQPETSTEDISDNLRDMALINKWFGGAKAVLVHILPLLRVCTSDPIRVLDAACGGGDISRRIVDEARKLGKLVDVIGLDLSAKVLDYAKRSSSDYPEITFIQADMLNPPYEAGNFDIVILTSVVHHLEPEEVITALQAARKISRGHVIAVDIVRSRLAHLGFCLITRILHFSPVTLHDGAISIYRAYTPSELNTFASRTGLSECKLHKHRFFRMALVYKCADHDGVVDASSSD